MGLGINALNVNGNCIQELGPMAMSYANNRCPTVYRTGDVGGALLGLGIVMVVGGGVIAALPGRPYKIDTYTFEQQPVSPAANNH